MPRIAAIAALCLAVAGVGWVLLDRGGRAAAPQYVTEGVDRGPVTALVTATGVVEPIVTVQVGTYVSGPIRAIYADFNSKVRRGQVVAEIDPAPFAVKVQEAEANLANARARVEKSRADLERKRLSLERGVKLRAEDYLSQDGLDAAKSDEAQARAQLALDEA